MIERYCIGRRMVGRQEWLAWRQDGIGASEAPQLLGIAPSPLSLYLSKVDPPRESESTIPQRVGKMLEPLIADLYGKETGDTIRVQQECFSHPEHSFMRATIDGISNSGKIVEFKTVGARSRNSVGSDGTDEIPDTWITQVQWQMLVTGITQADVAVLIGNDDFRIFAIPFEKRIASLLVARAREFWSRVEARQPPAPTNDDDPTQVARLFRECRGEIELPTDLVEAAMRYEAASRAIKQLNEIRDRERVRLLYGMENAELARCNDLIEVRRSVVSVKEHTVRSSTQVRLKVKVNVPEESYDFAPEISGRSGHIAALLAQTQDDSGQPDANQS